MGEPGIQRGLAEWKALSSADEYYIYIYARKTIVPHLECLVDSFFHLALGMPRPGPLLFPLGGGSMFGLFIYPCMHLSLARESKEEISIGA